MNYIELNLIHKQKMDTLCNNLEHFEWEDTTFMDYLKGGLPQLRNTSSNSAITGLFHSLTKNIVVILFTIQILLLLFLK